MVRALGGLPERTPLNARVVGVVDREDYRIEKVVFESQPRFYVTANLYLPKTGQPPYPGILFPEGHEAGAKAHEAWQQMLGSFATIRIRGAHLGSAGAGRAFAILRPRGEGLEAAQLDHRALHAGHPVPAGRRQRGPLHHLGRHARAGLPAVA
jgi:hypothetical protein